MTTTQAKRGVSIRAFLIILAITALLAWGGLLLFTRYIAPANALDFLVFFVLLGPALLCTLAPLIYLVTRAILARRLYRPTMIQVIREAGLISALVIFNLLLRVLHSWSIFTAIVSFGIIVVTEILALSWK
jgi:hypothetical protein